tara:strand:- start:9742 stop:9957 length:216 start_codon:yes stop_codon:yes gene_type:complete
MKTTRLEDELLLIAQVEMALDKGPSWGEPAKRMSHDLRLMLANAYFRERAWTVGFFTSLLVNVVLLMGVFL